MEAGAAAGRLPELEAIAWRGRVDAAWLRRRGWEWTGWTALVVATFGAPAVALPLIEPWLAVVSLLCVAHGWGICELYAARGVTPLRSEARRASAAAEARALGLLGDLVGHEARALAAETGLAMHRGRLGVWLVGHGGALMVRSGGRRVDCWCVRVKDAAGLPYGDRVAHLLLALREDEEGFATVANHGFSGAGWRVRRRLPRKMRAALDVARAAARRGSAATLTPAHGAVAQLGERRAGSA